MTAYYNEHDRFAAAWLRELIADGLIAPGDVDEMDIQDVTPADLVGYTQCHFFAGIGVWSLALRLAGWPDDRPIWTGSCPCQPFSAAGKGGGFADERHLWPAFHWLISQCRPPVVVGEQVSSADGLAWIDLVLADLDSAGYIGGAVDTCAAGWGAPHIRQRLYWVAHAISERGCVRLAGGENATDAWVAGKARGLADADAAGQSLERRELPQNGDAQPRRDADGRCEDGRPGPLNGLWRNADWLYCRDGKWRPVESGAFPLVAARTLRNRVGALRGAGNALNVAQAEGFIRAVIATRRPRALAGTI